MRILIVEDNIDLYNDYMIRLFANLLPMHQLAISHASSIEEASQALNGEWDIILMDYALGSPFKMADSDEVLRNGKDLVLRRRNLEGAKSSEPGAHVVPAFIIGTSSNQVGNRLMVEAGANTSYLKLHVVEMAKEIKQKL